MSAMVKPAKDPVEPLDIDQPTPEWRDIRPLQGGGDNTNERVMMPHTEMCEDIKVTSVEEGCDVERVIMPQNDETTSIFKQWKDETTADSTALEK